MTTLYDVVNGQVEQPFPPPSYPSTPEPRKPSPDLEEQLAKVRAERLRRIEVEKTRRLLLRELEAFVQHFWSILEPDIPLVWNWHLTVLCKVLMGVEQTPDSKGVINIPPGLGKSLLLVFFRGYLWAKRPSLRFLSASYVSDLSVRDNVKLRELILSATYQELFPHVKIKGDQNAKEKFETTAGGWSIATSVGGPGTGEHPDYKFIDDPISEKQSRSEAERKAANQWIDRTLTTRGVVRDVRTVMIMQRLAEDDPTGHVLAQGGWWHVRFPMRYEGVRVDTRTGEVIHRPDPLDPRTTEGELLMPQLFTEQKVYTIELALGPYGTAGQLQQRPVPEGGGLFKREWFKFVDSGPSMARRVRGWDTAGTEDDGCYTVGVRVAEVNGIIYIEDVVRGQWGPAGVDTVMRQVTEFDGIGVAQRELREPAAAGKAVMAARTKLLRGYDHGEFVATGDKVTMAKPLRAQAEAGNVYLVRGDWNETFLREFENFPGKLKDQVDAAACAYNAVLLEPEPELSDWATWRKH
jgi:predicted phage terminase large subunit-like protein